MLVDGVISAVKDFGCIVTFYNEVKALAPVSELRSFSIYQSVCFSLQGLTCISDSDEFASSPSVLVSVGQVVRCRILTVNPKESKMRVSLKVSAPLHAYGDNAAINKGPIV